MTRRMLLSAAISGGIRHCHGQTAAEGNRRCRSAPARLGHPENWKLLRYDVGHAESPEMRNDIVAFLRERL